MTTKDALAKALLLTMNNEQLPEEAAHLTTSSVTGNTPILQKIEEMILDFHCVYRSQPTIVVIRTDVGRKVKLLGFATSRV